MRLLAKPQIRCTTDEKQCLIVSINDAQREETMTRIPLEDRLTRSLARKRDRIGLIRERRRAKGDRCLSNAEMKLMADMSSIETKLAQLRLTKQT